MSFCSRENILNPTFNQTLKRMGFLLFLYCVFIITAKSISQSGIKRRSWVDGEVKLKTKDDERVASCYAGWCVPYCFSRFDFPVEMAGQLRSAKVSVLDGGFEIASKDPGQPISFLNKQFQYSLGIPKKAGYVNNQLSVYNGDFQLLYQNDFRVLSWLPQVFYGNNITQPLKVSVLADRNTSLVARGLPNVRGAISVQNQNEITSDATAVIENRSKNAPLNVPDKCESIDPYTVACKLFLLSYPGMARVLNDITAVVPSETEVELSVKSHMVGFNYDQTVFKQVMTLVPDLLEPTVDIRMSDINWVILYSEYIFPNFNIYSPEPIPDLIQVSVNLIDSDAITSIDGFNTKKINGKLDFDRIFKEKSWYSLSYALSRIKMHLKESVNPFDHFEFEVTVYDVSNPSKPKKLGAVASTVYNSLKSKGEPLPTRPSLNTQCRLSGTYSEWGLENV